MHTRRCITNQYALDARRDWSKNTPLVLCYSLLVLRFCFRLFLTSLESFIIAHIKIVLIMTDRHTYTQTYIHIYKYYCNLKMKRRKKKINKKLHELFLGNAITFATWQDIEWMIVLRADRFQRNNHIFRNECTRAHTYMHRKTITEIHT